MYENWICSFGILFSLFVITLHAIFFCTSLSHFTPSCLPLSGVRCKFRTENTWGCSIYESVCVRVWVCLCLCVLGREKTLHERSSESPHSTQMGLIKNLKLWFLSTSHMLSVTHTYTLMHISSHYQYQQGHQAIFNFHCHFFLLQPLFSTLLWLAEGDPVKICTNRILCDVYDSLSLCYTALSSLIWYMAPTASKCTMLDCAAHLTVHHSYVSNFCCHICLFPLFIILHFLSVYSLYFYSQFPLPSKELSCTCMHILLFF